MYKIVNDPTTAGMFDVAASVGKYAGPLIGASSFIYDGLNIDNLQQMNDEERAAEQALIDSMLQILSAGMEGAISGRLSALIEKSTKKR